MIRAAKPSDAAAIVDIWNRVIRDTTITFTTIEKTPDGITDLMANSPVFVAETDRVIGFCTFGPFRAGHHHTHIERQYY